VCTTQQDLFTCACQSTPTSLLGSVIPSVSTMSGQYIEIGGLRIDISQFDLSDTSSKVAEVRTANIVLISLVVATVSLRLLARTLIIKRIFADDGKSVPSGSTNMLTWHSSDRPCCCFHVSTCSNLHRW
jgi:hypothetical protein